MFILLTRVSDFFTKLYKFIIELLPFVATAFVITSLADLNQFLWFIALLLYILQKLGFNINIAKRFSKLRIGGIGLDILLKRWFATASVVGKLEDEYIEATGDTILDVSKKTIQEAKKMKNWFTNFKLWLKYNKAQILGVVALILFVFDYIYQFTDKLGVPKYYIYTLAALIVAVLFWVLGIEGWTSNTTNQIKENAVIARKEKNKLFNKLESELKVIDAEINKIVALADENEVIPQSYQADYNQWIAKRKTLAAKIKKLKAELDL